MSRGLGDVYKRQEEKPFPFKSNDEDDSLPQEEVIIEGEADIIEDESSEQPNN